MSIRNSNNKDYREKGNFLPLRYDLLNHPNFNKLSSNAIKLLLSMSRQLIFSGGTFINSAEVKCTYKLMKRYGWNSKDMLSKGIQELLHYKFIIITRQGGRRIANLYGLTFLELNTHKEKLDFTNLHVFRHAWKSKKSLFNPRKK